MASTVAGLAASSFAQSIVQRTTATRHHDTPGHIHTTVRLYSRPSAPHYSQARGIGYAPGASALFGKRQLDQVKVLRPLIGRRRTQGSRGVTVCSVAGTATGEAFEAQPTEEPEHMKVTFGSRLRAILFYLTTLLIAVPLFVVMLIIFPFEYLFDRYRRRALHFVNNMWANATTALFYKIDVIGAENLPPKETPAVYVANHQSYLDIFSLFRLWVPFKFVSKTSNFFLPIVGWSMFLTGHIPIKRMDAKSQVACLKLCRKMLDNGGPVIFFPEGTRSKDQKLASFKKGAFSIAAKANVPIVPITLVGTGKLMPSGKESSLRSGEIKIIVHPPISGTDPNQLLQESQEVIHKTLKEYGAE